MAVTLAQAPVTAAANGSPTATATATLGGAPTAGNLLMCCVTYNTTSGSTVATPAGFTSVYNNETVPGMNFRAVRVFTKTSAGTETSISVVYTANAAPFDGFTIFYAELNGSVQTPRTGLFLETNTPPTAVLTDTNAANMVFAFVCNPASSGGAFTGWTEVFQASGVAIGNENFNGDYQYYTGSPTTTYQTSSTGANAGSTVIFAVSDTSGNARITQEALETLAIPNPKARITQQAAEFLDIPLRSASNARITQQTFESLEIPLRSTSHARITQQSVEFLYIPGVFGGYSDTEDFYYIRRPQVTP
jgi:hypothetical protein